VRAAGVAVDVVGHSWSPEVGPAIDALYRPILSVHESPERARNRRLCATLSVRLRAMNVSFRGFAAYDGMDTCERTASHLLGITRSLVLKTRAERLRDAPYERVLISRWDVVWHRPVHLLDMRVAPGPRRAATDAASADMHHSPR
jgi:hypothetical protein